MPTQELLLTARLNIRDNAGRLHSCRALLDTCSSANFITERLATSLYLPTTKCSVPIGAMNQLQTKTNNSVLATIESRLSSYNKTLTFLTVDSITNLVPDERLSRMDFRLPNNVKLADPNFDQPAEIDMLLGFGITLSTLCVGQIRLSQPTEQDLFLQKTHLGWVIGGAIPNSSTSLPYRQCHITKLAGIMNRFWEIEQVPPVRTHTSQETECENHFTTHIQRESEGRYIVALPFNSNKDQLGESRSMALQRLYGLEKRLARDPQLKQEYHRVMNEYLHLGHMAKIEDNHSSNTGYYLPHHPVIKSESDTTKVRVVFDGSAKTTTGVSLNDVLMVGPTIQDDIFTHMLRFRRHQYVLTGDIEKMYRQFKVREEDRKYQQILWRDHNDKASTLQLNTVTFGLSSAPFLAIRCIKQLAEDEKTDFPLASNILSRDLYVDDLLTGAETFEEALRIRKEVTELLRKGGLHIRQWASNNLQLLQGLPSNAINLKLQSKEDNTIKTLGTHWNSTEDAFVYTVSDFPEQTRVTKRTILSHIARIYDPLGLLGPVVTHAKLIMQQLWTEKLDWDESLPAELHTRWTTFASQLSMLNELTFRRSILLPNTRNVQLHGFCDASEKAYGACIYIRATDQDGHVQTTLLCAKSRVAPLNTKHDNQGGTPPDGPPLTIPKLELCGATLLATLYSTVRTSLDMDIDKTIFWCDNTAVLGWLNMAPTKLTTFVANRVAHIQGQTNVRDWRHVRTQHNPADAISRGLLPTAFLADQQWAKGPDWLQQDESTWPKLDIYLTKELPGLRKLKCFATPLHSDILIRYSSFKRLQRIVGILLRFKQPNKYKGALSAEELIISRNKIFHLMQASEFAQELKDLTTTRRVSSRSKILPLTPFVDKDGLIRVGGRLKNADVPFDEKHPILLPKSHHVTDLLIREEHERHHHAGGQTTLCLLRKHFWISNGRNQVRKIIRKCMRCARANPIAVDYIMGNLPAVRVKPARPFQHVGVDFCGPFYVKEKKERNRGRTKVYAAVFTCLVVKAVHLELVSDMSTEAFLAALKRFIARRGKCAIIFSDNGTNFVGTQNELQALEKHLQFTEAYQYCMEAGIKWHFIPPQSPNFGGIWEAAVKSFKHHLKRVIGEQLLTYEQLYTFMTEVETILNSRPLSALSSDPNDLSVLSTGHFLIGNSLTSLPEPNLSGIKEDRLSLWQYISKMRQDFWARWQKEYLNNLNVRPKWRQGTHTIRKNAIVLLREHHRPPMSWSIGRVIEALPGTDGIVRVARIKTTTGILERNVRHLAILPVEEA